jgi:cytochrome P450
VQENSDFQRDPFLYLDRELPKAPYSLRLPAGELCLTDAAASREVLANAAGRYQDHSDFFHTRRGHFGPRALQVEIGRAAMKVLYTCMQARAPHLPEAIERALEPRSEWPDAGNWLVYRHLAPALVGPARPAALRSRVDQIVARGVLAGARERHSLLGRAFFRFRALGDLAREIQAARRAGENDPSDVLGVLAAAARPEIAGREVPAKELAEVFLSFVFAVGGSVGFTLGWCLYLLGQNPGSTAPPSWVVREALRLYPVAWLMGRRPATPHLLAGAAVEPKDEVVVCPYAVHRNPRHWEDAESFRPDRWREDPEPEAFLPFGWGPHKCVGASFSLRLVEDVLRLIGERWRLRTEPHAARPLAGPALAPPPFSLFLEKLTRLPAPGEKTQPERR